MKRNLIAAVAFLATNAAVAQTMLPGDLGGDWSRLHRVPETTSYVPNGARDEQPNYEYIIYREQGPNFEFIL